MTAGFLIENLKGLSLGESRLSLGREGPVPWGIRLIDCACDRMSCLDFKGSFSAAARRVWQEGTL